MKTGTFDRPWVALPAKPLRVDDRYRYWGDPPPEPSERLRYWVEQVERGWLPSKHLRIEGYDTSAQWFGVYLWEYLNVLAPLIDERLAGIAARTAT